MKFLSFLLVLAIVSICPTPPVVAQSVEEFDATLPPLEDPSAATEPESHPDQEKVVRRIIEKTNGFREKQGLQPVTSDPRLKETAQYFADYMARTGKYGHTADGQRPSERAKRHGYEFCIVLENIAYAYRSTGFSTKALTGKFFKGWKTSEEHRQNMLDPDVTETGVAVARSEDAPQYFAVQMFGRPKSGAIRFEILNRSGESVKYVLERSKQDKSFTLPPRFRRTHMQCRPSQLDLGWTDKQDAIPVSDGKRYVVQAEDGKLELTSEQSDSEEDSKDASESK